MIDIIKRKNGHNRYLVLTARDASQIMGSKPNLKVYRCEQASEAESLFGILSDNEKTNVCHKLHSGDSAQGGFIGSAFYNHLLVQQFKRQNLHMYFTGISHYTDSKGILSEDDEGTFYLVPAIFGIECYGVKFYPFAAKDKITRGFVERLNLDEMKAQQLVTHFYNNTGSMYKSGVPIFPLPEHYENHLVKLLVDGEAIVIHRPRSLCVPNMASPSEMAAVSPSSLKEEVVDKTCQPFGMFIIRCDKRDFQLNVLETEFNLNDSQHVLQVVAQTDTPKTVFIEHEKDKCKKNKKNCPVVIIDGGEYSSHKTIDKPFKLIAKPYKKEEDLGFWDFMQSYFLPDLRDLEPQVYTVATDGCDDIKEQAALVHCFPSFKWKGKVEAGMKHKYNAAGLLEDREFNFGGEIEYVRNGNSTKFGGKSTSTDNKEVSFPKLESMLTSITSKLDNIKNNCQETALNSAGKTLSDLKKEAGTDDLVVVEIVPPKVSLGGGIELAESSKTGMVGMAGNVALDLSPLIGLKVETDLLDWLIMTFSGGLGAFLLQVKGLAARSKAKIAEVNGSGVLNSSAKKDMTKELKDKEGKAIFDAELYVKFTAEGSISAKCEWKKDVDDSWLSVEGDKTASANAKITFKLAAVAKAKAEAFCVKISIGAELHLAGAKSSAEGIGIETTLFATTAENKPALGGNIRFTGMAIYFTSWAEAGIKTAESDSDKVASSDRGKKKRALNMSEKKTYDCKETIFEESTWPNPKDSKLLSKTGL